MAKKTGGPGVKTRTRTRSATWVLGAASLLLMAAAAIGCGGPAWRTVTDPHGFTVELPAGWVARVEDSGFVVCQPGTAAKTGEVRPSAFLWPVYASRSTKAEDLLAEVWPAVFGEWPRGSTRWLESRGVLVATIGAGAPAKGMAVVSAGDGSGLVSGWWAPANEVNAWRPVCLRILQSFTYDPTTARPDEVGMLRLSPWTDPNEGAFTVGVPTGWKAEGGLYRPYVDAAISLRMSQGEKWMLFEQPAVPIYACPNWVLDMAGFTRGSAYNPGGSPTDLVVWDYLSGADYIKEIFVPALARSADGLKVVKREGLEVPASRNPLVARTSGGQATLTDGSGLSYKVVAVTQLIQVPGSPGLWTASVTAYRSRPEDLAAMARLVEAVGASFRVDAGWAAREAQAVAQRTRIISQTADEIAQIISETFAYQSAVQEHASHEWSNAMLGRTDVYDPDSGQVWNVPVGAETYWRRGFEIWGSATTSAPAPDPDFVELQELGG